TTRLSRWATTDARPKKGTSSSAASTTSSSSRSPRPREGDDDPMKLASLLRTLAIAPLLLACACGGTSAITRRYPPEHSEVTDPTQWSSPGLRFYRVAMVGVQDRSSLSIVALDENGTMIEGSDLFHRFASLPPQELAEHACYTLIDGCIPLGAADPSA